MGEVLSPDRLMDRLESLAISSGAHLNPAVTIGFVFTPRELRGRGYASRLVAELSQAQLDAGRGFCVLYTDLGNPTSNAIYQRVGYELVEEVVETVDEPVRVRQVRRGGGQPGPGLQGALLNRACHATFSQKI